jgi:hypothetical protein
MLMLVRPLRVASELTSTRSLVAKPPAAVRVLSAVELPPVTLDDLALPVKLD